MTTEKAQFMAAVQGAGSNPNFLDEARIALVAEKEVERALKEAREALLNPEPVPPDAAGMHEPKTGLIEPVPGSNLAALNKGVAQEGRRRELVALKERIAGAKNLDALYRALSNKKFVKLVFGEKNLSGEELAHVLENYEQNFVSQGSIDFEEVAMNVPDKCGIRDKFVDLVSAKIPVGPLNIKAVNNLDVKDPDQALSSAPPAMPNALATPDINVGEPTPEEVFQNSVAGSNDFAELYANIEFCELAESGGVYFSGTFMVDGKPANGVELAHVLEDLSERVLSGDIDLKDAAAKAPEEFGIRDKFVALVGAAIESDQQSKANAINATSMPMSPDAVPPVLPPMPAAPAVLDIPPAPISSPDIPTALAANDPDHSAGTAPDSAAAKSSDPGPATWEDAKKAAAGQSEMLFQGRRYFNAGDDVFHLAVDDSLQQTRSGSGSSHDTAHVNASAAPASTSVGIPVIAQNIPTSPAGPAAIPPVPTGVENLPGEPPHPTPPTGAPKNPEPGEPTMAERIASAQKELDDARAIYAEKEHANTSSWRTVFKVIGVKARTGEQEKAVKGFRKEYQAKQNALLDLKLEELKGKNLDEKALQQEMGTLLKFVRFDEGEKLYDSRHAKSGFFNKITEWYRGTNWKTKLAIGAALTGLTAGSVVWGAASVTMAAVALKTAISTLSGSAMADSLSRGIYQKSREVAAELDKEDKMDSIEQLESSDAKFEKLGKFLKDDIEQSDARLQDRKGKDAWRKIGSVLFGVGMGTLTAVLGANSVHAAQLKADAAEAAAKKAAQHAADEAAKKAAAAAAQHAGGTTFQSDMLIDQERFAEFGSGADQADAAANAGNHVADAAAGATAEQVTAAHETAKNLYEQALTVPKGGSIEGAIIKQLAAYDPSISHGEAGRIAHQMVLEKFQEMHEAGSVASLDDFNRVSENMHFNIAGDADGYFIKDVADADLGTWTRHAAQAAHEATAQHAAVAVSHVEATAAIPTPPVEVVANAISPVQAIENHTNAAFNTMLLEGQQRTGLRTIDYFARQIVGGASTPGAGFDILTMNDNVPNMNQMLGLTVDSVLKHGTNASPEQMKHLGEFVTSAMKAFPGTGPTSGNFIGGETTASYLKRITMLMIHAQEQGTEVKLAGFGVLQKGL